MQRLIRICRIKWCYPFYLFQTRNTLFRLPFLGYSFWKNLVQNIKKCLFELKIGTKTNSNIKKSINGDVYFCLYICSVCLDRKYPFWVNLVQKFKKSQFKTKFGIVYNLLINYLNLIIQKQLLTSVLQKSCLRSSRFQMFFKTGVLKNFAIFTGKHQWWSLLIKLQA